MKKQVFNILSAAILVWFPAVTNSQEMVKALKKVNGNVKFTVYPEATHDSWTETYNNQELYEWFLKHRKSK